jgi:hypothetical protein
MVSLGHLTDNWHFCSIPFREKPYAEKAIAYGGNSQVLMQILADECYPPEAQQLGLP